MKTLWLRLGPKYQRLVVVGAVAVAGSFFVLVCSAPSQQVTTAQEKGRQGHVRHIFTDRTAQETGIDNLAASVKFLSRQNEQMQETLSLLQVCRRGNLFRNEQMSRKLYQR